MQRKRNIRREPSTYPPYDSRRVYNGALYETQSSDESNDDGLPFLISSNDDVRSIGSKSKKVKIYVGNISPNTTPDILVEHFRTQCSLLESGSNISVTGVSIPNRDHKKELFRGYAFVILDIKDFSSIEEEVELLINRTNGNEIDGMAIRVNTYHKKRRQEVKGNDDRFGEKYSKKKPLPQIKGDFKTRYTIDDTVCLPTEMKVLRKIVIKHVSTHEKYLACRPLAAHTTEAFEEALVFVNNFNRKSGEKPDVILDSGCGTGRSTLLLGERFPNSIVLGIDRSLSRLERNFLFRGVERSDEKDGMDEERHDLQLKESSPMTQEVPAFRNVLLIRAELTDFWRCCLNAGWNIQRHYLLYPNPYPKISRVKNRWYAHPSFPIILMLGGDLIVRSNWKQYLDEFQSSLEICDDFLSLGIGDEISITCRHGNYAKKYLPARDDRNGPMELKDRDIPMTNFEKKYFKCGERTYELKLIDHTRKEK